MTCSSSTVDIEEQTLDTFAVEFCSATDTKSFHELQRQQQYEESIRNKQYIETKLKHVIFPSNKWIRLWDGLMLMLLFVVAFTIPYQIGVSGGYYLYNNTGWMVANIVMDVLFIVDTLLYFWRAYRGIDGRLVFNLTKIRKRYLRTFFIFNLLGNFPANLIFLFNNYDESDNYDAGITVVLKLLDLLKLFRLTRLVILLSTSEAINDFRQSRSSQAKIELLKYTCLLMIVSHWFACTWSFLVLLQAGTFNEDLLEDNNWIAYWYRENYEDGMINPVGWGQDLDRYVLSMFWAIQTITSIGYGNITPYSTVEWWFGCILMLLAGVMWAYIIGGLVGVAAALNERDEIHRNRTDQANQMIRHFTRNDSSMSEEDKIGFRESDIKVFGKRIKEYIQHQKMYSNNFSSVNKVGQSFPVIETLSPELQLMSSFMLLKEYLEAVPYLSSRFLSVKERSIVAKECFLIELASGEVVQMDESVNNSGRGIFVIYSGSAFVAREKYDTFSERKTNSFLLTTGHAFGADQVLLEDDALGTGGSIRFVTYAKILFIPRKVVLDALKRNPKAWKDCARWKYLHAALRSFEGKTRQPDRPLEKKRSFVMSYVG